MITKKAILALFIDYREAFSWDELEKRFVSNRGDFANFKKIIFKLLDDKILIRNAAGIFYHHQNPDFIKGTIKVNRKNFGFVSKDGEPDSSYFVPPPNIGNALDGDIVYFCLQKSSNPKFKDTLEAKVIGVYERKIHHLVGIARSSYRGNMYLQLNNLKLQQYQTSLVNSSGVKVGHYYEADLVEFKRGILFIKITRDLGHEAEVGADIMAVVKEFGLDNQFTGRTLNEAHNISPVLTEEDVAQAIHHGRTDFRNNLLVTIDGDDSKDFDDAICVKKEANGNFELIVAIADVAHYVHPNSALDDTARKRSFSTYLIDQVIPMLPEKLSNGICSLNPGANRFCMVCVIVFDPQGKIIHTNIHQGVMKSHARLTYNEVNTMLESGTWNHHQDIKSMLSEAFELYKILWSNRIANGFVEFELREPKFKLNDKKEIVDISYRTRGDAEKLIESFMIAANEGVGHKIWKKDKPFLYRNHDKPTEAKLENLTKQLSTFGYEAHFSPTSIHSKDIQNVMTTLENKKLDLGLLAPIFLRSMEKAKYENYNIGHFGLASECYTHFTSPIRRYADLMVHRYLKQYLFHQPMPDGHKTDIALGQICDQINSNEIITTDCERAVNEMKMAEYMHRFEGQKFVGQVAAVVKFGVFVQLPNSIEGLVHIRDMEDDFYEYDADHFRLVGSQTSKIIQLGDTVTIQVKRADKFTRQIDFKFIN